MKQNNLDKRAILQPGLIELRTTLQGALSTFGNDPQLRRALIHAEGVVADRLGVTRQTLKRSERRSGER